MEVEALAAIKAVEFGSELGLHNSIIEGDSVVVSKALECKEFGLAPYAHLLKDVSLFPGFYSQFSYSHIKKDGNEIIHSLVRLASFDISTMYIVDRECSILHFTFCSD